MQFALDRWRVWPHAERVVSHLGHVFQDYGIVRRVRHVGTPAKGSMSSDQRAGTAIASALIKCDRSQSQYSSRSR